MSNFIGDFFSKMAFVWWKVLISVFLLLFSAVFSGLTLGLMGQDITQLTVLAESAAPKEQRRARKLLPVRRKGNLLLCTLLLANVMVNAALSICMSDMTGGLFGVLASTFFIVIFGEIVPQATFTRYSLAIGSALVIPVKVFIVMLYPIAKPISMLLNWSLGTDMGHIYDRRELVQLLEMHAERETGIGQGESKLMRAAMEFSSATAQDIMTKIDDVYMLDAETRLDADAMTAIWQTGHSRVPVFDGAATNVSGVLFVKDLILLDPADEMPLRTLLHFYPRELRMVFSDTKLPELLNYFQTGKGHLAIVRRVNADGDGDPFYENIGIVTLEDIIEYLIRDEIVDETDIYVDLQTKERVKRNVPDPWGNTPCAVRLTPHQASACASFLNSSVPLFAKNVFDAAAVTRIVAEAHIRDIKVIEDGGPVQARRIQLYTRGQPSEWFTLILSGKVDVVTGSDEFRCRMGAWDWLGARALTEDKFVPDFTAVVVSGCRVLQVSRQRYLKALYQYSERTKREPHMLPIHDAALPMYPELADPPPPPDT